MGGRARSWVPENLNLIANIPYLFHYEASKASRVKCDASHSELRACLEQEVEPNVWAPIAFASRFLDSAEIKYSTNELELLAIIRSCEHFRTYLLGQRFVILTDHKAIISALNETYGKKSYQSGLSRWADVLFRSIIRSNIYPVHPWVLWTICQDTRLLKHLYRHNMMNCLSLNLFKLFIRL